MWSEEQTRLLKEMNAQGLSAPEMGERLGKNRTTVLQKLRRMGLGRGKTKVGGNRPRLPSQVVEKDNLGVHILDLEYHHCRWPTGPMVFCGQPKWSGGGSYCDYHTKKAWIKSDG